MRRCAALLLAVWSASAFAAGDGMVTPSEDQVRVLTEDRVDSLRLERELQALGWEQFRTVIEAIPKLKADVDAYGPMGWEYVKGRYQSYAWHKNIDKLDAEEKRRLATLIATARQRE